LEMDYSATMNHAGFMAVNPAWFMV
jgi:hypothetical protein